jgi:hypothetical protein
MDYELHTAGLVEKALEDERVEGRQSAKRAVSGTQIINHLLGGSAVEAKVVR